MRFIERLFYQIMVRFFIVSNLEKSHAYNLCICFKVEFYPLVRAFECLICVHLINIRFYFTYIFIRLLISRLVIQNRLV